jgi:quercetin dioxygenase-like cupin family protein
MLKRFVVIAALAVAALALSIGMASATPSSGFSSTVLRDARLWGGTARVLIVKVVIEPGGSSGWHSHPAESHVFVTSGVATVYQPDCSSTTFPAGTSFVEERGHVLLVRNEGTEPLFNTVAFVGLAPGQAARTDEPAPPGCNVR